MAALCIAGAFLFIILLLLVLPVSLFLSYDDGLFWRLSFVGFTLYSSEREGRETAEREPEEDEKKRQSENGDFFRRLREERGFGGAVRHCAELARIILGKLIWLLRRVRIRGFRLSVVVASEDAAITALEYGGVCAALYPLLTWLSSCTDFKPKAVEVRADFDHGEPELKCSVTLRSHVILALIAAYKGYREYQLIKSLKRNVDVNE